MRKGDVMAVTEEALFPENAQSGSVRSAPNRHRSRGWDATLFQTEVVVAFRPADNLSLICGSTCQISVPSRRSAWFHGRGCSRRSASWHWTDQLMLVSGVTPDSEAVQFFVSLSEARFDLVVVVPRS